MLKKINYISLICLIVIISQSAFAQTNRRIDSLQELLNNEKNNSKIIRLHILMAEEMLLFDIKKSIKLSQQAVEMSTTQQEQAESFLVLGNSYYFNEKYDSSLVYFRKAITLLQKINDTKNLARAYNSIGNYFRTKLLNDSSLFYYNKSFEIARSIGSKSIEANNLICIGSLYSNNMHEYEKAEEFMLKGLHLIQQTNNKVIEIQALFNLGVIRRKVGDIEKAEEYYLATLDYYIENGYVYKEINVYNSLGGVFYSSQNYQKSQHYYSKMLELSKKKNYKNGLAAAYHNLATIYYDKNNVDTAILLYQKAIPINLETNNLSWLSNNYASLGLCYKQKKDYEPAIQYTLKSLEIDKKCKDQVGIAELYSNLGSIYLDKNMPDSSFKYLAMSQKIAEEINREQSLLDIFLNLSLFYKYKNQFKDAYNYLSKYNTIKDSVYKIERQEMVENLEIRYNVQKKDLEIEKNKSEIEILNKNIEIKNTTNIFLVVLTLFLLLLIIILYKFIILKNQRKAEKLLFEKQMLEKNAELKDTQLNKAKDEIKHQAILILEKNKIISEIREELETIKDNKQNFELEIDKISELLSARIVTDDSWVDFKQKFERVFPDFINKLKIKFGKLTDSEIRIACLIKLNINNKDIGSMLGISSESVAKAKYRFRKKINITDDNPLEDIISEI